MADMNPISDNFIQPGLDCLQAKMTTDLSQFVFPNDTPVAILDCTEAFAGLTDQEKLYAHYLAQASFAGGLIVLVQVSTPSAVCVFGGVRDGCDGPLSICVPQRHN